LYYSFRFLSLNQPLTMWKKNVIVNCFPLQQSCDSSANEIKGKLQTVSLPINLRNEKSLPPVSSQQQVKIHRFRAGYFYIVSFSYKLSNRTETWPRGNKTGEKNEVLSAAIQRTFSGRSCHPIRWDGSGWLLGSTMARSAGAAAGPMRVCPPPLACHGQTEEWSPPARAERPSGTQRFMKVRFSTCELHPGSNLYNSGAFDCAKNHKRQRRKRQSVTTKREKSQTPKSV